MFELKHKGKILEITRINDIFRYSIYSLGKPFGPAHKVFKSEICGNILNTLLSQINHHLTTAYSKSQFISTCNLLYNHLKRIKISDYNF
jgi:hypothetical protein